MLKVVKIGGNVVDNPQKLEAFLADFSKLEGDKILVHGGGKIASTISKSLGIEPKMIDGRRVTDRDTLGVVTMVYAGGVNKSIVASLRRLGCNAFGFCGADGGAIVSRRRSPEPIDYGFVGDPCVDKLSTDVYKMLITAGYTPVTAPITISETGDLLNTNADTVARSIAVAMSRVMVTELVYCFEKPGVMMDVDDEDSVISEITRDRYDILRSDGIISDGMIPKLDNAFDAILSGVESVVICNSDNLLVSGYAGTRLR